MTRALEEAQGLRVAIEGCGHGTLDAIYASVMKACEVRGWDGIDVLIIGGDFQAVRNASDLTVMSCPVKYREIGDFHAYYSGVTKAPYLTIFVGGNHEASSHLWELYYGGWVAPNIYYMGAANVVRLGGVRIAGMSGIWKGYNYRKPHYERLPYSQDDVKSIYHVREIDTRKLLQLKTQVDVGISHDWPTAIEKHGNQKALWRMKPDFEEESKDGSLGSKAAAWVMDRLRPPYWFAAHLHCKYAATKTYLDEVEPNKVEPIAAPNIINSENEAESCEEPVVPHNEDEIDLDMDEDDGLSIQNTASAGTNSVARSAEKPHDSISIPVSMTTVPSDVRAQLPAAFTRPSEPSWSSPSGKIQLGQPADIKNKTVRFLALDKCLPGRKFLQLLEVKPAESTKTGSGATSRSKPKFEYDPEWLAITRVFAPSIVLGDRNARVPPDLGESHYAPLVEKELKWVNENIAGERLEIPENFVITAPPFEVGMPEIVQEGPIEYDNPQMQQFCDLVGIENKFTATEEERSQRMRNGPPPSQERYDGGGRGGRGGGRGFGRGRGGRGRARGRGRGRAW